MKEGLRKYFILGMGVWAYSNGAVAQNNDYGINYIDLAGSCERNANARIENTGDDARASIVFGDYQVSTKSIQDESAYCRVSINFEVPQGWSLVLSEFTHSGYVFLDDYDSKAVYRTKYYIEGLPGRKSFKHEVDVTDTQFSPYFTAQDFISSQFIETPCSQGQDGENVLVVDTRMTLHPYDDLDQSWGYVDAIDTNSKLAFNYELKKCTPIKPGGANGVFPRSDIKFNITPGGGNGCPRASANFRVNDDMDAFSVVYNDFYAHAAYDDYSSPSFYKHCEWDIEFEDVPADLRYRIFSVNNSGYAYLEPGLAAQHTFSLFQFANRRNPLWKVERTLYNDSPYPFDTIRDSFYFSDNMLTDIIFEGIEEQAHYSGGIQQINEMCDQPTTLTYASTLEMWRLDGWKTDYGYGFPSGFVSLDATDGSVQGAQEHSDFLIVWEPEKEECRNRGNNRSGNNRGGNNRSGNWNSGDNRGGSWSSRGNGSIGSRHGGSGGSVGDRRGGNNGDRRGGNNGDRRGGIHGNHGGGNNGDRHGGSHGHSNGDRHGGSHGHNNGDRHGSVGSHHGGNQHGGGNGGRPRPRP